jgi:uncharacterized protein YlzI (FlbEa/FlbD family)
MEIKRIKIIDKIENVYDDNIDVAVELENGHTYVVSVATPKNLLTLMEDNKSDFLLAGAPMLIVKNLTEEVVEKAIQAYAEDDAYFLKFYAADLDVKTLDVLKDRYVARFKFINHLLEKDESIDIENYDLIDFNIKNDSNNNFG